MKAWKPQLTWKTILAQKIPNQNDRDDSKKYELKQITENLWIEEKIHHKAFPW